MRRVVVIGAGAAGAMAAIFAAQAGAETFLLERTKDGGRKILISGGGRCNVLPSRLDESRFITDSSPNTLKKIVRSWPLAAQIAFFEEALGVPLVEEAESAKLFPASHRARDVRDALFDRARALGVQLQFETRVTGVAASSGEIPARAGSFESLREPGASNATTSSTSSIVASVPTASDQSGGPSVSSATGASRLPNAPNAPPARGWTVMLDGAPSIQCDSVVVATGGLSVPNTGSDGWGLSLLAALGHTLHPRYAALTPLLSDPAPFGDLSGVSLEVTITAKGAGRSATASGGFLFTHHGYSGPSVLDVSHVIVRARQEQAEARVNVRWSGLDAAVWERALAAHGARTIAGAVRQEMPERLALALIKSVGLDTTQSLADLRRADRLRLIETLVRGPLPVTGDEGYKKAEVTGGGVRLGDIDPRTMESRVCPGLFLCGEVLDAFGPIGGYNFLWAWATGRAAGMGAAVES